MGRGSAGSGGAARGRRRAARPRRRLDPRGQRRRPRRGHRVAPPRRRPADGRRGRADGGRGADPGRPRFPGRDAEAGHRGLLDGPGRRLARRPLRHPGGVGAAAGARPRVRPAAARRQRVGAPRRGHHRARRPQPARGAPDRRPRRRADPARVRQLRPGTSGRCATTSSRSRSPSRRARASRSRARGRVAALAAAGRLQRPRGARPAPRRLPRTRAGVRPVLHRASLSEMVVPYGDPSPSHYIQNAFDAGRTGSGRWPNALELGCDCLGEIRYFDADVNDAAGEPVHMPNAICIHEEDAACCGGTWDWRNGDERGPPRRRLVVSSIAAIGNYDYGFFWYFYQDGTIESEVKLTGIVSTGAERARRASRATARRWRAGLNAMHPPALLQRAAGHRGRRRRRTRSTRSHPSRLPPGPENPYGNAFAVERSLLATERRPSATAWSTRLRPLAGRSSTRASPTGRRAGRLPTGARRERAVRSPSRTPPVRSRAALHRQARLGHAVRPGRDVRRGRLSEPARRRRRLPEWTCGRPHDRRRATSSLWYTFGHHHVPRPEDWPVMPVATIGFS